jgi:hypothetical protein
MSVRRLLHVCLAPVRIVDWGLGRVFGEPRTDESLALRDATERMEEMRRQIDRSHR